MDSLRFTTEDGQDSHGRTADVAKIQDEVAKLFEGFRLHLEEMFGRAVQSGSLHEVTRLTRRACSRTRDSTIPPERT